MMSIISYIQAFVATRREDDKGAAMVEYGILIAGIAVLVMAAVFLLGARIDTMFDSVVTRLGG
jgi:pilus assembly protein Flp/PilA